MFNHVIYRLLHFIEKRKYLWKNLWIDWRSYIGPTITFLVLRPQIIPIAIFRANYLFTIYKLSDIIWTPISSVFQHSLLIVIVRNIYSILKWATIVAWIFGINKYLQTSETSKYSPINDKIAILSSCQDIHTKINTSNNWTNLHCKKFYTYNKKIIFNNLYTLLI